LTDTPKPDRDEQTPAEKTEEVRALRERLQAEMAKKTTPGSE